MPHIDLDQLAKSLNLSAAQREQLESLARAAGQAGGVPPAASQASLRIHLTPGESLKADTAGVRGQQQPFVTAALGRLSPGLRKVLRTIEPQVLAWINAKPENARHFTTDPLGALRKAVPNMEREALAELERLRADSRARAGGLPFAGVDLQSITVDARPEPGQGGEGRARPKKTPPADPGTKLSAVRRVPE